MGKITLTPLQQTIINAFAHESIAKQFYFTGVTALSACYLHHRESEDIDLFSEQDFDNQPVEDFISSLSIRIGKTYKFTQREKVRIFYLESKKEAIKIDFNYYPYHRVEPEKGMHIDMLAVDSLRDIATNKFLTINQRTEVKDFVDLYFLLKTFTIWDLLYGVEAKFGMKLDMMMVASDFLKVDEFDFLPKMLVPLAIPTLQAFFRQQAIEIGKRITE